MNIESVNFAFNQYQFKSNTEARQRLWRKLGKLLKDGIPIIAGLKEIRALKKATDPISVAIDDWLRKMNNGSSLSDAIKAWVPSEEFMLIVASERSGVLEAGLTSVVKVSKAKAAISAAVYGGVIYPGFLILLAFAMMHMFSTKIVPAFTKAARGSDAWIGMARIAVDVASFMQVYLMWLLVAFVLFCILFLVSLSRWDSPLRTRLDRYPPYSIFRIMQGSSWLIALASLVEAGERIEDAVVLLADGSSKWARVRMNAALKGLRAGKNIGVALDKSGYGFPDREIISDIQLYSTKSGFDEALRIIGNDWVAESVDQIARLMKVVFMFALTAAGAVIIFVVSGLLSMQLQLAQLLQRAS